ncbi:MAG: zinc finger-like domain-containing protein [Kiritimatiellae bacterium]|nr:zinc finger-like domain-containing protein [Kiritimatiellia bacterium]
MKKYFIILISILFAFIFQVNGDSIRVCNSCGYEIIPATARFCGNCGNAADGSKNPNVVIPEQDNVPTTTEKAISAPDSKPSAQELIKLPLGEEDNKILIDAIQYYLKKSLIYFTKSSSNPYSNILTGYFLMQEADGLLRILPQNDSIAQEKIKQIASKKNQILNLIPKDNNYKCPRCKGSGYTEFHYLTHTNEVETKENSLVCALCNSRKTISKVYDKASINQIITQAKHEAYKQKEDNEFAKKITNRLIMSRLSTQQKSAYMKATASPCDSCFGFRKEQCKKCAGLGINKCTNKNCNNGYKKENKANNKGKNNIKRIEQLTMFNTCTDCKGATFVKCENCYATGLTICMKCQGTGKKDICVSCNGVGFSECSKCKKNINKKNDKNRACTDCAGSMLVLCKTCDGAGVK